VNTNDFPPPRPAAVPTIYAFASTHPDHRGLGHGRSVIDHLVGEAARIVKANLGHLHHAVFLDVYLKSVAAIGLYDKCGFQALGSGPFVDPLNKEPYRIMAKRLAE
jgi:ribosomal protein S18 acetylase RimI-like enzyme